MPAVVKKTPSEKIQDEVLDVADVMASVDLSGAPKLKPYRSLRLRDRAPILAMVENADDASAALQKTESLAGAVLEIAEMDELLEKVAVDPAAYAEWAVGDNAEARIAALFAQYVEQVGESMRSAN